MGYVSLFSNARAGAQQSIDPIVASFAGMARQQGNGMNSGGPYTLEHPSKSYGATSCTCGSCPMHRGAYGAGKARKNDNPRYGQSLGYTAGSTSGGSMTSTPSFGYRTSPMSYNGSAEHPSQYSQHTRSQY